MSGCGFKGGLQRKQPEQAGQTSLNDVPSMRIAGCVEENQLNQLIVSQARTNSNLIYILTQYRSGWTKLKRARWPAGVFLSQNTSRLCQVSGLNQVMEKITGTFWKQNTQIWTKKVRLAVVQILPMSLRGSRTSHFGSDLKNMETCCRAISEQTDRLLTFKWWQTVKTYWCRWKPTHATCNIIIQEFNIKTSVTNRYHKDCSPVRMRSSISAAWFSFSKNLSLITLGCLTQIISGPPWFPRGNCEACGRHAGRVSQKPKTQTCQHDSTLA